MQPRIRAIIAASAHAAGRHLRIAAEARDGHLQGYDGDHDARFGGTLPELRETARNVSIYLLVEDGAARGYDRSSSSHFSVQVSERLVQLYDHTERVWFQFDVQVA